MFVSLRPHRAAWITAIVMLLIALALPVEAQQRGQLVLDQGLVKVSNGPKVRIYNVPGTTVLLSVDDQIHTARNSAARVILSSGDEVVTLQANTVFKVEKENELAAESNTRLLTGNLTFEINPNRALVNGRKREFKIRTVTAVVGVRGSEGDVGFDPATGETAVVANEGDIYVVPPDLEGDELAQIPVPPGSDVSLTQETIKLPGADKPVAKEEAVAKTREENKQKQEEQQKQEQQQRQQQQQSQNQGQGQQQQKTQQQSQGQPQQKPDGQQQQSQSQGQGQQQQQSQSQPQQGGPSQSEGQPPPQQQGEGQPPQEGPPPGEEGSTARESGEEPPPPTDGEGPEPISEEPSTIEEPPTEEAPDLPEEELPPVEEPVIEEVEVEEVVVEEIEIEEVDLGDLEAITDQINE
ncbi:MAG: FecR family protein, partial [Proteobacteria bacterium]|nr:FecR family protein [Pseudomonadota bacterium]